MTGRERILTAIRGGCADHVPAAPDMYEMMPVRLSGKKSWEVLVYRDPPIWKACADACSKLGVDGFIPLAVPSENDPALAVVQKDDDQIVVRGYIEAGNKKKWTDWAIVYKDYQASAFVKASEIGLPESHSQYTAVKPEYDAVGKKYFEDAKGYLGDGGVVAPMVSLPALSHWQEEILAYYDKPEKVRDEKEKQGKAMLARAEEILSWEPDILMIGNSGMMLFNPEPIFRDLCLKWLKKVTALAKTYGVPTHLHCCGPSALLVEISAEETDLDGIEPLEVPPMGDCILKDIKKKFGGKLCLKGNLHTTDVLLMGSVKDVEDACKLAIDNAGEGGGFILSSGDQVPWDTPLENLEVMQNVAEEYGRY